MFTTETVHMASLTPDTRHLTTGQIAAICHVAPRTVSKWIDSGALKGFRIPGSRDRRVPRKELLTFLRQHGMPLGDMGHDRTRVLLLMADGEQATVVAVVLGSEHEIDVRVATTALAAGHQLAAFDPDAVVLDALIPTADVLPLMRPDATLVVVGGWPDPDPRVAPIARGHKTRDLLDAIRRATNGSR